MEGEGEAVVLVHGRMADSSMCGRIHGGNESDYVKESVANVRKLLGRGEVKIVEGADHIPRSRIRSSGPRSLNSSAPGNRSRPPDKPGTGPERRGSARCDRSVRISN